MASATYLAQDVGIHVGSLTLQDPDTQQVVTTVEVYSNIEVFVGRDAKRCQIHVASPFVSSRHVRIYTVVYDAGDLENVPPLVYAEDLSTNGTYWNSHVMRKGYASSLLSDGDTLEIAGHSQIHFKSAFASKGSQLTPLQQVEMEKFGDQYAVTPRLLGSGAFGKVYMAYDVKTGQQFACKVVDLEAVAAPARVNLSEEEESKFFARKSRLFAKIKRATKKTGKSKSPVMRQVEMQRQEALLLAGLSHPNILRVERVFQSSKTIFMLTELVTYGDLYSFLRKNGDRLQEDTAALIIRQVLLAVEYLHDRQIVHRDIKPDNILVTSLENGGRVVLADFGCAKRMNQGCQRMNSLVGTREYCAPELQPVREKGYSKAVDMWAIGCTAAVLLVGDVHYNQFNRSYERAGAMLEADMEALRISLRPKDFMQRLLDVDESSRMDVKQALQHEWFTHASQAGWFIEKYHDAVEDWTPHVIGESIVVDLDSCQKDSDSMCAGPVSEVDCAPSGPEETPKLMDECRSREVTDSSWEDLGVSRPQPLNASTTSMPQMPNLVSFPPKEEVPQIYALEVEKDVEVESDGYEFVSKVKREHVDRHRHRVERKFLYVSTFDGLSGERSAAQIESMIHTKDAIAKSTFTVAAADGLGRSSLIPRGDRARANPGQGGPSASKRPFRDESDDLGQVYEEVYNPITGKRKRLAYGRDVELLDRLL